MSNNKLTQTPSMTVGPYFAYGLTPEQSGYKLKSITSPVLVSEDTPGERITLRGKIYDGNGEIISDALIEIWQADAKGNYISRETPPTGDIFTGFGRCDAEPEREYRFETIKPGSIAEAHAPHINMIIFMRGMLSHAYTRVYFSDEINDDDAVFSSVPVERRSTIIAKPTEKDGEIIYHFDLHMQGENETVFFDV
jgi:protocatechuate 3,4-dioxygenase alpha subunit